MVITLLTQILFSSVCMCLCVFVCTRVWESMDVVHLYVMRCDVTTGLETLTSEEQRKQKTEKTDIAQSQTKTGIHPTLNLLPHLSKLLLQVRTLL